MHGHGLERAKIGVGTTHVATFWSSRVTQHQQLQASRKRTVREDLGSSRRQSGGGPDRVFVIGRHCGIGDSALPVLCCNSTTVRTFCCSSHPGVRALHCGRGPEHAGGGCKACEWCNGYVGTIGDHDETCAGRGLQNSVVVLFRTGAEVAGRFEPGCSGTEVIIAMTALGAGPVVWCAAHDSKGSSAKRLRDGIHR